MIINTSTYNQRPYTLRYKENMRRFRPETDTSHLNSAAVAWPISRTPPTPPHHLATTSSSNHHHHHHHHHNLELQLSTPIIEEDHSTQLQLSIGSENPSFLATRLKEQARKILTQAMEERNYAEEARQQAKRQIVLAEQEFVNAKRIRQQAQAELDKAHALREHAMDHINSTILQITCYACKHKFQCSATTTSKASSDE